MKLKEDCFYDGFATWCCAFAVTKRRGSQAAPPERLEANDVLSLQTLRSLLDFKLDGLAFVQALIAFGLNSREVDENVLAGLALNESVTFAGVEPLHSSLFSHFGNTSF